MKTTLLGVAGVWLCSALAWAGQPQDTGKTYLQWTHAEAANQLPPVPDGSDGQATSLGVAGPFAGVHNDALIVAGGANFPDGLPWVPIPGDPAGNTPSKIYYDTVFVLTKTENAAPVWTAAETKLPHALGYGVSIPTPKGVICIGGEWKTHTKDAQGKTETESHKSDMVFMLAWDVDAGTVPPAARDAVAIRQRYVDGSDHAEQFHGFPPLPAATTMAGGAIVDHKICVCGGATPDGATNAVWMLDLDGAKITKDNKGDVIPWVWQARPPIPGPARILPVVAAQSDGSTTNVYLFSGRVPGVADDLAILTDAYAFDPGKETWKQLRDVGKCTAQDKPCCVMAGSAVASGKYNILVFGGARGDVFLQILRLELQLKADQAAGNTDEAAKTLAALDRIRGEQHQGFSRDVLTYHTVTDTWAKLKNPIPAAVEKIDGRTRAKGGPVTTAAVRWGKDVVLVSGEIRPGVRSGQMLLARPISHGSFGGLNYTVLAIYLLALVIMGLYFSRRMHSTDDFFKAGNRIPWWAAGISIFGTQLSALTFMAIPAKTFATDWRYFWGNMTIVAIAPFIIFLFLPFYRRLNVTTAYEYLEMRFNLPVRLIGSVMFMLFQFGRIGIVLFLPSIALNVVTGIDINLCIVIMGVLCVLYTVMGGMEAVIWTDVMQVVVLMGGALLCLVLIPMQIEGGWNGTIELADAAGKFRLLDFRWDWQDATFFTIVASGFGLQLISYGTDQTVIQRYLTTKDELGARRAIWTNAVLTIPASLLFFGIGSMLYAFYCSHPQAMDPTLANESAIFPLFIVTQMPVGIAGLMVAAIFAAAMSSLDSSMNSVSAAFTTDFYQRFGKNISQTRALTVARLVTVLIGVLGTGFALWMAAQPNIKSLWDEFSKYIGLFGGGLGGLFLLAIFTTRTNGTGALVGIIGSGILQFFIKQYVPLHPWAYSVTGIVSCFVIGYLASAVVGTRGRDLSGLTLFTLQRGDSQEGLGIRD
ncbi:MAG: sodium/solute symporter [Candidatus Nealsonbacteria bacterium]|nr:sodium/solute symporter [Candidatus Nealsonbacteria bacterium]